MKLLVTGTTGFIGNHLTEKLLKDGHTITALVRPTSSTESLSTKKIPHYIFDTDIVALTAFMQQEQFDGVIHLASLFLAQHKPEDIKNLVESNVFLGTALLEASTKSNNPWFINTGTFWQHYNNAEYSPVNLYAATKQAFQTIAQYYIETAGINFVTIQLNDTFGLNDTRSKVFNLWMKISKSQEPLDMSPGEQKMDINYIENVVDGFVHMTALLEKDTDKTLRGEVFAISAQERYSLKELANIFEKVTGAKLPINWGKKEYRLREVMEPWNKGKPIPGFTPKVTLEEGIKKTFNS
jgi:nucleoside-diphosphate-sugar epimerase